MSKRALPSAAEEARLEKQAPGALPGVNPGGHWTWSVSRAPCKAVGSPGASPRPHQLSPWNEGRHPAVLSLPCLLDSVGESAYHKTGVKREK